LKICSFIFILVQIFKYFTHKNILSPIQAFKFYIFANINTQSHQLKWSLVVLGFTWKNLKRLQIPLSFTLAGSPIPWNIVGLRDIFHFYRIFVKVYQMKSLSNLSDYQFPFNGSNLWQNHDFIINKKSICIFERVFFFIINFLNY